MKPFLMALSSFLLVTSAFASGETIVLKKIDCESSTIKVEVKATHTKGDRIALIEWTVYKNGQFAEEFMSPLYFENQSLESFAGSTLGSDITINGSQAELLLKDDTYVLNCR